MAEALAAAIRVFRERGYHATSVADLKEATALAAGSLYKAFKDKRAVFLAAFDQYVSEREEARRSALQNGVTGMEMLRALLRTYAEQSSGVEGQRGCMVVGGAVALSTFDGELARRVKSVLSRNEALVADLLRKGQADGSIKPDIDVEVAARLMLCILQGMRVVGKTGRTRDEMFAVADAALRVIE